MTILITRTWLTDRSQPSIDASLSTRLLRYFFQSEEQEKRSADEVAAHGPSAPIVMAAATVAASSGLTVRSSLRQSENWRVPLGLAACSDCLCWLVQFVVLIFCVSVCCSPDSASISQRALTHPQPPFTIRASTWRCSSTSTNFENKVSRTMTACHLRVEPEPLLFCVWLINAALCLLCLQVIWCCPLSCPHTCSALCNESAID